jgi:hypothetical protein
MTDTTTAARAPFRPIFAATITPAGIEALTSVKGKGYIKMQGAQVSRNGGEPTTRTVMAFGKSADAVRDLLVEGKPVELAVQFDGGTVKIIGEVRAPATAEG